MDPVTATVHAAEQLLGARFGGTPTLTQPEDLGGSGASLVLRCRVSPNPFLQDRTVVIKQFPEFTADNNSGEVASTSEQVVWDAPDSRRGHSGLSEGSASAGASTPPSQDVLALIREIVAYQYTNTLSESVRPGPLLLAYSVERRMLILSDAGDGANFTEVLQWPNAEERHTAVRQLGRALGRMHAATFGGSDNYDTLLRRQSQKHRLDASMVVDSDIDIANLIHEGVRLVDRYGITLVPAVKDLAQEAAERQGRYQIRAFTPFDLTPDNIMLNKQVVFLDYEWASFRDIAFDVACVVVGFPQDHTTPALTDDECTEFLSAWAAEVSSVWPNARDINLVIERLLAPLIGWALMSLVMLVRGQQLSMKATRRQQQGAVNGPRESTDEDAQTQRDSAHSADTHPVSNEKQPARFDRLLPEQASDLATTIEAIGRFARRQDNERFVAVAEFATHLGAVLARVGGHPTPPAQ